MKKIITYIVLPLIFAGFTSCEGETTRSWIITNQSSSTITVTDHSSFYDKTNTTAIPSGGQEIIEILSQRGGSAKEVFASETFYSILITNALGDTTTIDCLGINTWKSEIVRKKKVPSVYDHKYYMIVKDEDF